MKSLTLRIFVAFWLIIGLLVGIAGLAGYTYAERMREALENFDMGDTVLAASAALEAGGRSGLVDWIKRQPLDMPMDVYVVDDNGDELLGRDLTPRMQRLMRRFADRRRNWHPDHRDRPNLREARPFTRLRSPDGEIFMLFLEPKRDLLQQWIGLRAGPAFLLLALLLSGAVSWALAQAIARPVRSFRDATVAIADGRLDTRVAATMRNRRDEIGLLARDLDAMASRLEASAKRQRELTRNVSHELRSPLARLRVALELARREAGDRPEFVRIDEETERLDAMIGQLLRYSRVDAEPDSRHESVDLGELLTQITDDANFECRSEGLDRVTVVLDAEDALTLHADRTAVVSIFENVLRNAIHHAPAGSDVTVSATRDGRDALVRVVDSGPGVDEAELEQVFEPFFRAADALASGRSGTGLGLAIAARATQSHGGSIRAENLPAGGFAVTVRLPLSA